MPSSKSKELNRMVQLPKEVLLLIWRHIDDLPTKCALSECSRGFHLELRPLLCSSIKKLSAQDLKAGDCSLRRSIECLWRRSDLTQSVQHLEVEKSVKCAYDERFYQSDSEEEIGDITLINLMVEEICVTDLDKTWLELASAKFMWRGLAGGSTDSLDSSTEHLNFPYQGGVSIRRAGQSGKAPASVQ